MRPPPRASSSAATGEAEARSILPLWLGLLGLGQEPFVEVGREAEAILQESVEDGPDGGYE